MPQATSRLRKLFRDDAAAFEVLGRNYDVDRGGVIHPLDVTRKVTKAESNALDYLFQEWDYEYLPAEPRP